MPKKLQVYPNERIDISDFVVASHEYTDATAQRDRAEFLSGGNSTILRGFEIELSDQTTSPGELTVYNGVALDAQGRVLHNEDSEVDSRTVTLVGVGVTFFLEAEFSGTLTDPDARAFLDPKFVNPGDLPPGKEFSLSVATRESEDWRVVTPVSTTGFTPGRVPLATLTTDGVGAITVGANPGMVLTTLRTTLAQQALSSSTSLVVHNCSSFPSSGTLLVGAETVTYSAVDRETCIITCSPLSSGKSAGDIVSLTSGSSRFVKIVTGSSSPSATDPDQRQRQFSGVESRGSALARSKYNSSERDSSNSESLRDYVDVLAAQIRELKYGSPTGMPAAAPSEVPASSRWYDYAGGLVQQRSAVTIGNGITSRGDYNATDISSSLVSAIAASPVGGLIIIKPGAYNWTANVTVAKSVRIQAYGATFTVTAGIPLDITTTALVAITGLTLGSQWIRGASSSNVELLDVTCKYDLSTSSTATLKARRTTFSGTTGANHALFLSSNQQTSIILDECFINATTARGIYGNISNSSITGCKFTGYVDTDTGADPTIENVILRDCYFNCGVVPYALSVYSNEFTYNNIVVDGCEFLADTVQVALVRIRASDSQGSVSVTNSKFMPFSFSAGLESARVQALLISMESSVGLVTIDSCTFKQDTVTPWAIGVEIYAPGMRTNIHGCKVEGFTQQIRVTEGETTIAGCRLGWDMGATTLPASTTLHGVALHTHSGANVSVKDTDISAVFSSFGGNTWYGIGLTTSSTSWATEAVVTISGCAISSTGANGRCIGVSPSSTSSHGNFSVSDCRIELDQLEAGVRAVTALTAPEDRFQIHNCVVNAKTTSAVTATSYGVFATSSAVSTTRPLEVHNLSVKSPAAPLDYGVYLGGSSYCSANINNLLVEDATAGVYVTSLYAIVSVSTAQFSSSVVDAVSTLSVGSIFLENVVAPSSVLRLQGAGFLPGGSRVLVSNAVAQQLIYGGSGGVTTVDLQVQDSVFSTALDATAITITPTTLSGPSFVSLSNVRAERTTATFLKTPVVAILGASSAISSVNVLGCKIRCPQFAGSTALAATEAALTIGDVANSFSIIGNTIYGFADPVDSHAIYCACDNGLVDSNNCYTSGFTTVNTFTGANVTIGTNKLT